MKMFRMALVLSALAVGSAGVINCSSDSEDDDGDGGSGGDSGGSGGKDSSGGTGGKASGGSGGSSSGGAGGKASGGAGGSSSGGSGGASGGAGGSASGGKGGGGGASGGAGGGAGAAGGAGGTAAAVSFTMVYDTILSKAPGNMATQQGCNSADCHGTTKGGVNFSTKMQAYETLVDEKVTAGNAATSKLFKVVSHTEAPNMPRNANKLPDAKIKMIEDWIKAGAKND